MRITHTFSNNSLSYQPRQTNTVKKKQCQKSYFQTNPYYTYRINFTGIKKNQLNGIDALIVNKYKAPIEKFRTVEYLYEWADEECKKIYEKDYFGNSVETMAQRVAMMDEWKDYLENENKEYSSTEKLLILKGITKDLKLDNDTILPVLNKGVLADTIYELKQNLKDNPQKNYDFAKIYTNNLRKFYLEDTKSENNDTKWIIIPSKKNDPDNFDSNVVKLKTLSHKSWCTKSNNAEPYLSQGDFHIYLENGQPKLGVRFADNEIEEVQGPQNNSKIPLIYLDEFNAHIEGKDYEQSKKTKAEISNAINLKAKVDAIKKDIEPALETNDYKKIFEHFGIGVTELEDGSLELSHFDEPEDLIYEDLGLNENNLFNNVSRIKGNAKFCRSTMTDLKNLKEIGGDANFMFSNFKTLGGLKRIGGNADFKHMPKLEDFGELEEIGKNFVTSTTEIKEFKHLKRIGGNIDINLTSIESLGSLEEIEGNFKWSYRLKNLGKLKRIGGNADFGHARINSLGELERIEKNANFKWSDIKTLNKLNYIGGDANFIGTDIEDYGKLKEIKGYIKAGREKREDIIRHMIKNGNYEITPTLFTKNPQYDKDDSESIIAKIIKNTVKRLKAEKKWGFSDDD